MNEETHPPSPLLKAILITQILTLGLVGWTYFANSSVRAEYKKQAEEYRAQMDSYKVKLAEWQKENAAYTNRMSQSLNP